MLAVQLTENADLLLDIINLILCIFQIDDLDGYGCLSGLVVAAIDLTKGSLSNSLFADIVVFWICALWRRCLLRFLALWIVAASYA